MQIYPTAVHFLGLQSDTANLKVPVPDADSGRITNEEKESDLSDFDLYIRWNFPPKSSPGPSRLVGDKSLSSHG